MSTVYDVAVVGAAGFLGSAISRELVSRGHRVAGFSRRDPVVVDGRLTPAARDATAIVWAAGDVTPAVADDRPDAVRGELDEFRVFVDAVTDRDLPPRVVLLSSGGAVYGRPAFPPFAERDEPHPANAYGAYKRAQEQVLEAAHRTATAVRVANAYGPGQAGRNGQGVLAAWMRAILAGDPVVIHGDGETERDYVYVDDVADAVARVVERPDAPAVLNIGTGVPVHLNDLLDLVEYVVGPERVRVERRPARGVDAPSTWLDVTLAREALAWEPSTPLAQGIARMWEWAQSA